MIGGSVFGGLLLLFFPIFLETDGFYDMNGRKLAFSVKVYKFLRVMGGYLATYRGGIALHISPRKAILVPYSDLDNERKRFSIMRSFRITSLKITVETGAEYLIYTLLVQTIFRLYFLSQGGKRENLRNNLWLREGDVLRISLHFVIRFNLFILMKSFFKSLKEKVKVLCQTKIRKSTI